MIMTNSSSIVASFANSRSWGSDSAMQEAESAVEAAREALSKAEAYLEEVSQREALALSVAEGIESAMISAGIDDPSVIEAAVSAALDKRFPKASGALTPATLEAIYGAIGSDEEIDSATIALRTGLPGETVSAGLQKLRKEGKVLSNGKRSRAGAWHRA